MIKIGKYMKAESVGCDPEVYVILAKNEDMIGHVEWDKRWKQYVFSPEFGALFSTDCMSAIAAFCKKLTEQKND